MFEIKPGHYHNAVGPYWTKHLVVSSDVGHTYEDTSDICMHTGVI